MIAYSTCLDAKYYAEDDNAFSSDFLASDGYSKSQKKKNVSKRARAQPVAPASSYHRLIGSG